MRSPKIKNIRLNEEETHKIQESVTKARSIRITINIDADTLSHFREEASRTGVPYQRLINRKLKESSKSESAGVGLGTYAARIDRVEAEIRNLKRALKAKMSS
jgi:predicted DNA binding CopG/RHH family protein